MARVAAAAQSRHARNRFLTLAGRFCAVALGVGLIGVMAVRASLGASWWWVVPAAAAGVALVAAAVIARAGRWSLARAAGEVDRAHQTDGALRTALEIADTDGDPELVALARARGGSVAAAADPAKAVTPARVEGWYWALGAATACVLAGLFVPQIDLNRPARRPDPSPLVRHAAEQIATAQTDAERVDPAAMPEPEAWSRARDELEALEQELLQGDAESDAPARSAAALEAAAEELERQTELAARIERELAERAAAYEPDERTPATELTERLADALARNDLLEAERVAREIDRSAPAMSESDRHALSEALEDLASTLEPPGAPEAQETLPTPDPGREPPDADPTPEREPPGGDEPAGPQPAAPPAEAQEPQTPEPRDEPGDGQDQPEERSEPGAPEGRPEPSGLPGDQSGGEPGEEPGEETGEEPGQQRGDQPGQQPNARPGEQPGDQTGEGRPSSISEALRERARDLREAPQQDQSPSEPAQEGVQPDPQASPPSGERPQPEPGQSQDQQQGQAQGRQQGPDDAPRPGQPSPQEQPGAEGEPPQPGQPEPGADGQPGEQPGEQPRDQPGEQPADPTAQPAGDPDGDPGGQPGPDADAPPGPLEEAVRNARRQRDARDESRRVAQSLRDRARGLLDPDAPPSPGGAGEQDAPIAGGGTPDDPARFEPVDASRGAPDPDAGTRIVGEWFDPDRTEMPGAQRRAAAGEMRRAARRARDAVENQQVPRRYRDLVQRVFERVDSRAGELGAETVAPQGADAP